MTGGPQDVFLSKFNVRRWAGIIHIDVLDIPPVLLDSRHAISRTLFSGIFDGIRLFIPIYSRFVIALEATWLAVEARIKKI
jgi:hypothetical protein